MLSYHIILGSTKLYHFSKTKMIMGKMALP